MEQTNAIKELIGRLRSFHSATTQAVATDLLKFEQILAIDPDMAIVRARRAIDIILRSIAAKQDIEVGTKPLDQLIGELNRTKNLPPLIEKHCRVVKDFGNLAAHGIDNISNFEDGGELSEYESHLTAISLVAVVRWFVDHHAQVLDADVRYIIRSGSQVSQEMIAQALTIDKQVYCDEFRGIPEVCYRWLDKNPDIYTLILDANTSNVVGYINAMPIEKDLFEIIETGTTIDVDISDEKIRRYNLPDFYLMYFSSIAINPSYASTSAFRSLYDAFIDKLLALARQDIYITEIMADAVTLDGVKLCEFAGMKRIKETNHGSYIYKMSLLPPSLRVTTSSGRSLLTFYQKKYEEFRGLIL